MNQQIVSVDWLHENQYRENLIILDASPKLTASSKVSKHPGLTIALARPFRIKENFSNTESPYPNTIPSAEQFQRGCRELGINHDSEIVIFDNLGIYSSPRVWWLFNLMGHENVKVLDGGLPKWISNGYETVADAELEKDYEEGNFKATMQSEYLLSYDDICANINTNEYLIIDARSAGRYQGTAAEPRKTLQSGKIPNSANVPYQTILEDGKFKSAEEIRKIFAQATNDKLHDLPLAYSCGSGMTACIIMLASEIAGQESRCLFDGSWTEYAMREGLVKD